MAANPRTKVLLEVVFEGLVGATALNLATTLSSKEARLPDRDEGVWESVVEDLAIEDGILVKNAHVRILCYEGSVYDVELNFVLEDANARSKNLLQSSMHKFSLKLAGKHSVHSCYGGLEPAVDEETRLFTNERLGPIFLE